MTRSQLAAIALSLVISIRGLERPYHLDLIALVCQTEGLGVPGSWIPR